ncbi:hypothetical protein BRD02_01775 [Halobacteriales archaeon QS_8_69_73]|nr:MAG: hypothetical protein BRD02_01775 [Halobacteriales archaeon QS_8_69_73]
MPRRYATPTAPSRRPAPARLEAAGELDGPVTQNVDGLHRAVGSDDPVAVHGNGSRVVCTGCGRRRDANLILDRVREEEVPPTCRRCCGRGRRRSRPTPTWSPARRCRSSPRRRCRRPPPGGARRSSPPSSRRRCRTAPSATSGATSRRRSRGWPRRC